MKILISILFLLYSNLGFGQNWKTIPGTKIEFSNFIHTNQDNWYEYHFEYFKKGDRLIVVEKYLADDFYKVFNNYPFAFDSVFNNSLLRTSRSEHDFEVFDSITLKTNYRFAILLTDRQLVVGHNEVIWIMKNVSWGQSAGNPCFINISFLMQHNKKPKIKFLSAKNQYCEI